MFGTQQLNTHVNKKKKNRKRKAIARDHPDHINIYSMPQKLKQNGIGVWIAGQMIVLGRTTCFLFLQQIKD